MAGSVNKVILVGNLGADPDVRTTSGGQTVCTLSIATSDSWMDKQSNERKERTEWHRVVVWGRQAEMCQRYLSKGRKVFVEGRLQTRSWDDPQSGQKRYTTEIVANPFGVTFLDSGGGDRSGGGGNYGGGGGNHGGGGGNYGGGGGGNYGGGGGGGGNYGGGGGGNYGGGGGYGGPPQGGGYGGPPQGGGGGGGGGGGAPAPGGDPGYLDDDDIPF